MKIKEGFRDLMGYFQNGSSCPRGHTTTIKNPEQIFFLLQD
jgi:hypothetical protein